MMKRFLIEALFILMISLVLSLAYNITSPAGIILLKKAFKIRGEIKKDMITLEVDKFLKNLPKDMRE